MDLFQGVIYVLWGDEGSFLSVVEREARWLCYEKWVRGKKAMTSGIEYCLKIYLAFCYTQYLICFHYVFISAWLLVFPTSKGEMFLFSFLFFYKNLNPILFLNPIVQKIINSASLGRHTLYIKGSSLAWFLGGDI